MSRRSIRLERGSSYQPDDDAASTSSTGSTGQIRYRESPVRVFKKRSGGRRAAGSSRASSRGSSVCDLVNTDDVDMAPGPCSSHQWRSPVSRATTSTACLPPSTSSKPEFPGFSSGYSSSEEGGYTSSLSGGLSSAQSPAAAEYGSVREVLQFPGRALSMIFWWIGTSWYSFTSRISLLDVFLLSRRTAALRKGLLLFLLLVFLAFGVWYWYPHMSAYLASPAERIRPDSYTTIRPVVNGQIPQASVSSLWAELHAELQQREARWMPRVQELDNLLREVTLLKQEGLKQKLMAERAQTDMASLRESLRNVESGEGSQWVQFKQNFEQQISDLRTDVVGLQTASGQLTQRMDSQREMHLKAVQGVKAELSDWLVQQLSSELATGRSGVVLRPDLQRELEGLEKRLLDRIGQEWEQKKGEVWKAVGETLQQDGVGAITVNDVEQIVKRALNLYRADAIGMPDYALESSGASVLNTRCSQTYQTRSACLSLFGFPLWYHSESPRTVIQPELYPGKCWAFQGSEGFLVISLSYPVHITHVTVDHLPKALSPTGRIDSAPRDFAVYGLSNETKGGTLLGQFTYDHEGPSIQTFKLLKSVKEVYRLVELRVLSNWGHPEYTCVYRFRVHGQLWTG